VTGGVGWTEPPRSGGAGFAGAGAGRLILVGLSHHVAPVELRERVTLDLERAAMLSAVARRRGLPLDVQPDRALHGLGANGGGCGCARGACRRIASAAFSTASTTRQLPSTCSGSPPGSTRSYPVRARSSARCAMRSSPSTQARSSTVSSGRRWPSASAFAPRRRSAKARRRSRPRPRPWPPRCSAT